jgi:transcriptional regulator with XRE-family HTH domain
MILKWARPGSNGRHPPCKRIYSVLFGFSGAAGSYLRRSEGCAVLARPSTGDGCRTVCAHHVRTTRSSLGLPADPPDPSLAYSVQCYSQRVSDKSEVLREVMLETSITQSELSRISGVRQPSISQFLSGKVDLSDEQLDRLLSCMGYRLEVVRRPIVPELTRSERRSWRLHRQLAIHLTRSTLPRWRPSIEDNLDRLRENVTGQPHRRNLERWQTLVDRGDEPGLHRVLTGLDRDSIEMREVSPMGGLLSPDERSDVLRTAS